ncbi:MAG: hypothetical protein WBE21_14525, partial [Candidatus Acidiferrales bacterium]
AKNLVRREDIQVLRDEVHVVTTTAQEIEAKISSDLWDRQKQWEMKREVLFEASKLLARVEERLLRLESLIQVGKTRLGDSDWTSAWHDGLVEWTKTSAAFERVISLVTVVCALETTATFLKFHGLVASIAGGLAQKDESAYQTRSKEVVEGALEIRVAIRRELGIPPIPQSNESSATRVRAQPRPNTS